MDELKNLAFDQIAARVDLLESRKLIDEAFSVFVSRQGPPTKVTAQFLT